MCYGLIKHWPAPVSLFHISDSVARHTQFSITCATLIVARIEGVQGLGDERAVLLCIEVD